MALISIKTDFDNLTQREKDIFNAGFELGLKEVKLEPQPLWKYQVLDAIKIGTFTGGMVLGLISSILIK